MMCNPHVGLVYTVVVNTHMHGYTNTQARAFTPPRFICQHDSWTLAEADFAKQNPLLGFTGASNIPSKKGKHFDTHLDECAVCVYDQASSCWLVCTSV